jgi:pheromone shutdown protein TraB
VIAGAQALGEKVDPSGDAQYRADAATLPARGRARLEKLEAQLRAMFDDELQRRVQEHLRDRHPELVAELVAERDAYMKKHLAAATMKASMHAILSESDYRLLLNVLHPDRAPEDRKERFARAFDAVRKLDPYIQAVKA